MNFRRLLTGWVLLAAALAGQRLLAAPPIETLARVHWMGLNQVSASTNAAQFMKVWQLPPTKALAAQTLDKFSQSPWRWLHRSVDTNTAALLRPLLDDVLADESYLQIRSVTGRPAEFAFAIRLDERRAALWQTNLGQVLKSLTGIPPVPAPSGHFGWSLNKHHDPDLIELTRVGGWTVVGAAEDFNSLIAELRARTERALSPWNGRNGSDWLEADLNPAALLSCLTNAGSGAVWWGEATDEPASLHQSEATTAREDSRPTESGKAYHYPVPTRLYFSVSGNGDNVLTHATADFSQPLALELKPWNIPTNLIHGPLTSFTAARGLAPWLGNLPAWQKLEFSPPPDQAYLWSQAGTPFQTYFAALLPGASNQVWQLSKRLVQNGNPWLTAHAQGSFQWLTNPGRIVWYDALIISPWLVPITTNQQDYVMGGLYAIESGDLDVPSQDMLQTVLNTTNLVFYQSERTGGRVEDGFFITQLFRVIFKKAQLPPDAKATAWLKNVESQLGTSTTLVTQTGPAQLSFARQSTVGLTALELHLLGDWLESPDFPRGLHTFLAPPEK
jgi:hypothetical protein